MQTERNERIKKHQWSFLTNYLRKEKITYNQYLQSEHWKDLKERYWKSKLNNFRCYACGNIGKLQLHHRTYRRIGHERLNDMILLCADCHKETHRIEKERPNGILWGAAKRLKKNLAK
jgi:hypothetical protein